MSRKERKRLVVMHQVQAGGLLLKEGAERVRVSYRQAKRIWRRLCKDGEGEVVHRSRGCVSNRRSPPALRKRALELYDQGYGDFGPTLAAEKLAEEHGVVLSRETLRRRLLVAHLWQGRTKERRRPRREPLRALRGLARGRCSPRLQRRFAAGDSLGACLKIGPYRTRAKSRLEVCATESQPPSVVSFPSIGSLPADRGLRFFRHAFQSSCADFTRLRR
jgi:hypothetical protein